MVYNIPLWQEILIYSYVFLAITTFAFLSKFRFLGINLIPPKYKILISVFSPIILTVLLALSPLLILGALIFLATMRRKKSNFRITIRKL